MYKIWLDKPIIIEISFPCWFYDVIKSLLNESFVLVTRVKPFPALVWLISGSLMMKPSFVPILVITVVPLTRKLRLVAGDDIYNARWQNSILCLRLMYYHSANATMLEMLLYFSRFRFDLSSETHLCRKKDSRGHFGYLLHVLRRWCLFTKKRPIIFLYDIGRFISLSCLRIAL